MKKILRKTKISLLAVVEGKAEKNLLEHLRSIYLPRHSGRSLKVMGGYGKGAAGTIRYALSVEMHSAFDKKIVLTDTDADWSLATVKKAEAAGYDVLGSEPCLERWLLNIHSMSRQVSTGEAKKEFKRRFGQEAHASGVFERHFAKSVLQEKGLDSEELKFLIEFLTGRSWP